MWVSIWACSAQNTQHSRKSANTGPESRQNTWSRYKVYVMYCYVWKRTWLFLRKINATWNYTRTFASKLKMIFKSIDVTNFNSVFTSTLKISGPTFILDSIVCQIYYFIRDLRFSGRWLRRLSHLWCGAVLQLQLYSLNIANCHSIKQHLCFVSLLPALLNTEF
jgi:L-lactate permease